MLVCEPRVRSKNSIPSPAIATAVIAVAAFPDASRFVPGLSPGADTRAKEGMEITVVPKS